MRDDAYEKDLPFSFNLLSESIMARVYTSRASMDSGGEKDYGTDASYKIRT
ncbi:hypothetical protein [Liquorilactobacillus satsumensis]|uniref:hypothetical protein n=1 Tax=Liquorilactobacillus satsumensis TaxID=259059 RepID=UPI0039E7AA42